MSQSTADSCGKATLDTLHRSALFDAESQDAVQRTLRLASASLHAPVAVLSIGDGDRQVLRAHVHADAAIPASVEAYAELMRASHGRAAFVLNDAVAGSADAGVAPPVTFAATPLAVRGSCEVIGMLAIADVAGRTDQDRIVATLRDLASALADQLWLAAENAGLRQKQANLELQKQVFGLIAEGAPIDRVLGSLASFIEHHSVGTLCVIHLLDGNGRMQVVAAPTMPESLIAPITDIEPSVSGCAAARAAFRGEAVVIPDAKSFESLPGLAGMVQQGIRSVWSFPIQSSGVVFGTIGLYRTNEGEPDDEQLHLISVGSSTARIAIDRRRAEAALLSSEIYHRSLIENSSDFVLVLEADGRTRYLSSRFAQAVGCGQDDVRSLSQVVVAEDRALLDAVLAELLRSDEQEFEFRIHAGDGSIRHILGTGTNLLDNPAVQGLVINARDVTQQKLAIAAVRDSEERYRLVARVSSDLIWDWDAATNSLVWPARDKAVFGYEPADLPRSFDEWASTVHPEDRARVLEGLDRMLRDSDAATWSDEYRMLQADGKYAIVLDRAFVVRGPDGTVRRVIGSITDQTTRLMLEEQLRQAQRMEAIGRLAGGIAHDFNNLLTVIEGFTAMLLEELADGAHGMPLLEIQKAATRAAALTRQLLAFSRRQVLQPRLVDLNDVVRGVGGMLCRLLPADVSLETTLSNGELLVHADIGQLEQVILNLVINAREAMQQGGIVSVNTAAVRVAHSDAERQPGPKSGEYIRLSVEDNGCGMEPDIVAHIFEPFFTTKESGTGLGLATVYGIIEQSGGYVDVHSSPGAGSRFDVYLPFSEALGGVSLVNEAIDGDTSPGHEVILIVEDDPSVRNLTRRLLARQGYQVFAADDGPSALELISTEAVLPDLLLTDVVLPHMSGPIVAERVQALKPDTAVVFMSGYTDEHLGEHGVLGEEVAFLPKPFQAGRLLTLVREQLDVRAAVRLAQSTSRSVPEVASCR